MDIPTLFVIGAGASAGYNLPLGSELVGEIVDSLSQSTLPPGSLDHGDLLAESIHQDSMRTLAHRVRESRSPTIDAFLRHAPDRDALLNAMASVIWRAEDKALQYDKKATDDWISWLYHNRLEQHPDNFQQNSFAVLSFNYDRLPQAIFATMMCNLFGHSSKKCLEVVQQELTGDLPRFTHVHGCISPPLTTSLVGNEADLEKIRSNFVEGVAGSNCSDLRTMFDPPNEEMKKEVANLVCWADRVIFLGIGYHQQMLDLFNIQGMSGVQPWMIHARFFGGTAMGLDRGTLGRLSSWGGDKFVRGDPDENCTAFLARHLAE
jgi:hypothetical protein